MKSAVPCIVLLMVFAGSIGEATWDDANSRGLIPYWQDGGDWYTFFVFVNGSETASDVLYLRLEGPHGSPCSDTSTAYGIRAGEMLTFSTTPEVPVWVPTTASYGWARFRAEEGGFIHPYCVIYNQVTQSGYTVPAYPEDHGF